MAKLTQSKKGKENFKSVRKWRRKRKVIFGNSMKLNTSTNFASKSYTCEGFESKGVISNYRSHNQDLGGRSNFCQWPRSMKIGLGIEMMVSKSETT